MTKNEAVNFLKNMIGQESARTIGKSGSFVELMSYHVQALSMGIKALEQEPCEDAISRQAAVYIASGFCHPANIADELAKLPSVNPRPKTGRWIYQEGYVPYKWKCNQCSVEFKTDFNYCPHCGAKMEE